MRELRVEDALLYLDQVKVEFGDRPHIYNEFLEIMKTFKTHQIDTPGVIRRVSNLFHGNKKLVLGFNTFLPEGYKIELPEDGNGPPVAVFRAPGETITHVLTGPDDGAQKPAAQPAAAAGFPAGAQAQQSFAPLGQVQGIRASLGQPAVGAAAAPTGYAHAAGAGLHLQQPPAHLGHAAAMPAAAGVPGRASMPAAMAGGVQERSPPAAAPAAAQKPAAEPQQQPGMEFDHAINYVTTIKKRFANEPETYKKFLEILHTYQKEQRGIKEVLEEVSILFADHPDLLKEFTFFLPDSVQAEAKAQLEEAAREAEARKRAKEAAAQYATQPQATAAPPAAPVAAPAAQQQQAQPAEEATPSRPSNPIPFGATMGRSREREHEIFRSVVYGAISFKPVRPPRKNMPTIAQAAAKNGRPTVLPRVLVQPNTAETDFFEKAKKHLNRKELAADRPSATRVRHTPHQEFLKCLHLYATGVLPKDEMMLLLRGLFMQGHAPKSGINVGGGASNPKIANDAHELLRDLEAILVGRGPYADQQTNLKCKHKCGSKRIRDIDFDDEERPTPSYQFLPSDFSKSLFFAHAGKTDSDAKVLNDDLVIVGSSDPGTETPEDYDAVKIRRNIYEEVMFRIEDERFEVDMAIERNALAMRQIEPIAEEVTMLREIEEKDGQPIGRLQYKLKPKTLNSIQINAIGRIYGEKGDEVIEHLTRNPLATVPIIYQRLRQKDQEWRKQKSELLAKWRALTEANYEGSKDFLCYPLKQKLERSLSDDRLLEECKKARSFCSSPEKRSSSSINFGLSSPDRSAVLYEPYGVVELKMQSAAHHIAISLLIHQIQKSFSKSPASREKIGRILSEFVMPFFDYPAEWFADEVRESALEDGSTIVQYAVGQHVRTTFGDGVIVSPLEKDSDSKTRYHVKLPFGLGYVRPNAILHGIGSQDEAKHIRRDGIMVVDDEEEVATEGEKVRLDKKFKLLFGSQSIYLFIRLYTSLVSLLDEIETQARDVVVTEDPAANYYDPMKSDDEKATPAKIDFGSMISKLKNVISGKVSGKDFETYCRKLCPDAVHKMAALPRLIDRCANMLNETAHEDLLLPLFDYCQYTGANPVELREKCRELDEKIDFRIQYNVDNGRLYFSYLPKNESLATAAGDDEDGSDDDESDGPMDDDGDVESDDDDEDDVMDVEDEEEDLRQVKRPKLK
mmetsp:Transcript_54447/g.157450  ORF Transcript_54447/g.157450 Transcript_54447/m.157450 type:complete len:1191 (-) Transcript_54447:32-3604(-)